MRYLICVAAAIPLLTACEQKLPEHAAPPAAVAPDTTAVQPPSSPPPVAPMATPEPAPAPAPAASPAAAGGTYVVAAGDTLYGIARKHGVSGKDLARWNRIKDPRRLRVGQELRLTPP